MLVKRCLDAEVIKKIMTHPRVYPWISDDSSPKSSEFEPVIHDSIYYLVVEDKDPIAVFMYHQHNAITFEVHTCVLPAGYGEKAIKAAVLSMHWMFRNTNAKKIVTHVPENNVKAKSFAERCGLIHEGVNRKSFLKNSKIYDQYLLGITEAELCQQQRQ